MNGNESAGNWTASHDGIHSVFVNEESNSMLMSVFTATEEEFAAFWGRCFTKVFPAYFTESEDVLSVFLHFVCYVSSSTFSAALSDFKFQVPKVMLFVARNDFGPSVAYFSPPS